MGSMARLASILRIVILTASGPAVSAALPAATTATPAFAPKAGTYAAAQSVTISDATAGATIYYTTNGATPTTASTQYTTPIKVAADETLKAIAVAKGDGNSAVASAAYTILAAKPVFSRKAGTYVGPQRLTLSDTTAGAVIYYTTNGSTPTTNSTKYTAPLTIAHSETVKALAVAKGYGNSAVVSAAYTIETAPPVLSPKPGTFVGSQKVTLSDATAGAAIYYTTNGSTPTVNSTKYEGPITIAVTETLHAIAIASGDAASTVTSGTYTIDAAAPVFSPAGGTYPAPQSVSITDATAGAAIYFTTNGSTPTTNSARYSGPIKVGVNETLKAIAAVKGDGDSAVASAAYTIVTSAPVFSPKAGTYSAAQSVTITDATAGAAIYYTTNGTTPTVSSTKYDGPIKIAVTETVKAIAVASGDSPSAVTSGTYTIGVATPVFSPAGGTYSAPQRIAITDATAGATIYYTTNGSTPTTASTRYTTPIAVSTTEKIEAIAVKSGLANSAVASASYVIVSLHYTEVVKHSFNGADGDGYFPNSGLILGPDGNFYGLTDAGGANDADEGGAGTVFKITPDGVESVFYSFDSPVYGGNDIATTPNSLLLGADGNFYGTSRGDGAFVFKITPGGAESTVYVFGDSGSDDGTGPNALIQGKDGNLYGVTGGGGALSFGIVFKLTTSGEETVLYTFAGKPGDGGSPSSIIQASDGNFYGTTFIGGTHNLGTVYKITPDGAETVLYSFGTNDNDGTRPETGLVQGTDGNFYGTTLEGGAHSLGTVYKVTPEGTETVLYSFSGNPDGEIPNAPLVKGADGNFYGSTAEGGTHGVGTVFQITSEGAETVVWTFQSMSDTDGAGPVGPVLFDTDGNIWGTTYGGGAVTIPSGVDACAGGCGAVFEIKDGVGGAKTPTDADPRLQQVPGQTRPFGH